MTQEFTEKMKAIQNELVDEIATYFKTGAIECHVFGSIAREENDALSDIDIWITFADLKIQMAIGERMDSYAKFGEIVLIHEMQNNFPLDGIQTAIIYKIKGELVRVDFYLCPLSSSRILPKSKILFDKQNIEAGSIISETKRTPRNLSDRITFLISMCFNGIKKVVRRDKAFTDFLTDELQKYEKEIPELGSIPREPNFNMLKKTLSVLDTVSNQEQKVAISEISKFLAKVELFTK